MAVADLGFSIALGHSNLRPSGHALPDDGRSYEFHTGTSRSPGVLLASMTLLHDSIPDNLFVYSLLQLLLQSSRPFYALHLVVDGADIKNVEPLT